MLSLKKYSFCFILIIVFVLKFSTAQVVHNFTNFSLKEGLSNNYVNCIYMDVEGWIWCGTFDGLNRYNGYEFKQYTGSGDSTKIKGSMVKTIYEDSQNILWFGTEKGLNKYNREKDNFQWFTKISNDSFSELTIIHAIAEDKEGNLWLGTEEGLLQFNKKGNILTRTEDFEMFNLSHDPVYALFYDSRDCLWIGTGNGIKVVDLNTKKTKEYYISYPGGVDKRVNQIYCFFMDSQNTLWVGTYLGGLNWYNKATDKFEHVNFPYADIRTNTVKDIIESDETHLLVATRNGLIQYNRTTGALNLIKNNPFNSNSLVHNSVLSILKDVNNDIWVGTRGGISYLNKNIQVFRNVKYVPNNNMFLNSQEIWSIIEDKEGKLWIGTEDGGVNIFDRQSNTFTYLNKENSKLKSNNIKSLLEDSDGKVWIGTYMGGLYVFDKKTGTLVAYNRQVNNKSSIGDDRIWDIFKDSNGQLWFGTSNGLNLFNKKTGEFVHYLNDLSFKAIQFITEDSRGNLLLTADEQTVYVFNPHGGVVKEYSYPARYIFEDKDKNIWIGTIREGLLKLSPEYELLKRYTINEGLCDNTVYGIIEDFNGLLWLSTLNGISHFDPKNEKFKNYHEYSGLPSNKFNYGAFCKTSKNELVFGSNNGITIFKPDEVRNNTNISPIVFTEFRINNKPVEISKKIYGSVVLENTINHTEKITVNYHHSVLTFEFATLNYAASKNNMYSYKLDGFDNDFSPPSHNRIATYTNLNPGEYTLLVNAANNDGIWNKEPKKIVIEVLPPYWKTWWFKLLLFLMLGSLIGFVFMVVMKQERLKHQIAFERLQAKRIHEMDAMKFKLFTDISHEIRTPLTLIMSPLDRILSNDCPKEEINNHLRLMHRNSKRLLTLVNQLLDYRKLEAGKLSLKFSKNNLVPFVEGIVESFRDLSKERNINLLFYSVSEKINIWFDADKLEIVIYNLLSNAFKFTNNGGSINITISLVFQQITKNLGENDNQNKYVLVQVQDNGVGIAEDQIDKIFNRFYQSENSGKINSSGTGIGLALSKEIIELHHGEIKVDSKEGKGAVFYIYLPAEDVGQTASDKKKDNTEGSQVVMDNKAATGEKESIMSDKNIVLLVEDNEELLNFIASYFEDQYTVLTAFDGEVGLEKALKYIPDVIISDVLMPKMDGNEMCKRLKAESTTNHIPVILLTALSSKEHEKEGFISGADAYMTKPFDPEILKVRVDSMLEQRKNLQEKYKKNFNLNLSAEDAKSPDDIFIQKAINVVNKNISDVDFDINKFSKEIGVSRTQLYRKFDALMDITVKDFIKRVRLEKAAVYLQQGKLNVSEIAYKVGFKDVSYFRKCFKSHFGNSPSEYVKTSNLS